MIQKKLCIPLLALLLLAGCNQDTQHIRLPNSDLYDHPTAEAPLIIEPFTPDVTVPDVDLRKVDLPFDRDETFTIGPRGDIFFAKEDGTVWNYTYGDGYACYDSSGTAENYTKPLHAFDLTPKRLELEEHYGVLIDADNTLWGWNIFSNDGTAPTRLMEDIADVCTTFHEVLALDKNGSLWVIPRSSSTPYLLMEGVRDLSCHVWPLALCDNSDLYSIQFKNVNGQISDICPTRIMEEVFAIEWGSVYLSDGTLFTLEEDLKPVKRFIGAVQTAYCNDGLLILDALGRIWLLDGLTEPSLVAEHARQLIDHSQILYLDTDDNLCMIRNGSLVVLDRDVQKVCAGYDLDSPETHTILYTKGDGILWRKGLTENSDHFDPLMEPELICNDLLSSDAEEEVLSIVSINIAPVLAEMIENRKIIPNHYLALIEAISGNTNLPAQLKSYNQATADFRLLYTDAAAQMIIDTYDIKREDDQPAGTTALDIMHFTAEQKTQIEVLSTAALYPDPRSQAVQNTSLDGFDYASINHLHSPALLQNWSKAPDDLTAYFTLVDDLMATLPKADLQTPLASAHSTIIESILERKPVDPADINKIEYEWLSPKLTLYNDLTSQLYSHYSARGTEIVCGLLQISESSFTDEFSKMAEQIGTLALHSNAVQLIHGDPLLSKYIAGELGGSAGMWPQQLHEMDSQYSPHQLTEYFDLILSLLIELCA